MGAFADSHLGRLRTLVGGRLLLVPGARIVIEDPGSGRILLQRRGDFGVWGLPGGNAEEGEGLEAVVVRETLEETGLVVSDVRPFGFACDPAHETIAFPNGDRCQFFVLMFWTRTFSGSPLADGDESRALGWFPPGALPEMLPNMARSVEAWRRFVACGAFQMI
ncbi:DNA mismatch repair protein MutT [Allostella vacuolata]|nr:DNA mismatch repair protein MutT [Stella vacuolata]